MSGGGGAGARNARKKAKAASKKTRGRVKIKVEFIDNKLRRYTTFSKRKTGIMKKAYELSTLTGTQVWPLTQFCVKYKPLIGEDIFVPPSNSLVSYP